MTEVPTEDLRENTALLDKAKLNSLTSGKVEVQNEILELFLLNAQECMSLMEKACNDSYSAKWEYAAQEIKNTADIIGATELRDSSALAEAVAHSEVENKIKILSSLRKKMQKLRIFVRNTRY